MEPSHGWGPRLGFAGVGGPALLYRYRLVAHIITVLFLRTGEIPMTQFDRIDARRSGIVQPASIVRARVGLGSAFACDLTERAHAVNRLST